MVWCNDLLTLTFPKNKSQYHVLYLFSAVHAINQSTRNKTDFLISVIIFYAFLASDLLLFYLFPINMWHIYALLSFGRRWPQMSGKNMLCENNKKTENNSTRFSHSAEQCHTQSTRWCLYTFLVLRLCLCIFFVCIFEPVCAWARARVCKRQKIQ